MIARITIYAMLTVKKKQRNAILSQYTLYSTYYVVARLASAGWIESGHLFGEVTSANSTEERKKDMCEWDTDTQNVQTRTRVSIDMCPKQSIGIGVKFRSSPHLIRHARNSFQGSISKNWWR